MLRPLPARLEGRTPNRPTFEVDQHQLARDSPTPSRAQASHRRLFHRLKLGPVQPTGMSTASLPSPLLLAPGVELWLDVLVVAEDVLRVVCSLEFDEALVVMTVGSADPLIPLVAQVVHVHVLAGVRAHRVPERPRPRDVSVLFARF